MNVIPFGFTDKQEINWLLSGFTFGILWYTKSRLLCGLQVNSEYVCF